MTSKKGGGRESSETPASGPPNEGYYGAAANPAAYLACHCDQLIPNDENGRRRLRSHFSAMDRTTGAQERIRALEARVKELDAMLYEMRSQRDYAVAIQEDRER